MSHCECWSLRTKCSVAFSRRRVQPVSLELSIDADEEKRCDQNDQRAGDQSGLLAREQLMLQGERAAQPSEPTTERAPIRMRRLSQGVENAGLGRTTIYELDPSYRLKRALEQVEGSAESAPIISPNKCFESGQASEGAEIIIGWRRSGGRFLCDLCGEAEDDEADRISSRASS
jgi:hypothetical protein